MPNFEVGSAPKSKLSVCACFKNNVKTRKLSTAVITSLKLDILVYIFLFNLKDLSVSSSLDFPRCVLRLSSPEERDTRHNQQRRDLSVVLTVLFVNLIKYVLK